MRWYWAGKVNTMLEPELEPWSAGSVGKLKVWGETLKPCPEAGLWRTWVERSRDVRVPGTEGGFGEYPQSILAQFPGCSTACCPTMPMSSLSGFLFLASNLPLTRRMVSAGQRWLITELGIVRVSVWSFAASRWAKESSLEPEHAICPRQGILCNCPSEHKCPVESREDKEWKVEGLVGSRHWVRCFTQMPFVLR